MTDVYLEAQRRAGVPISISIVPGMVAVYIVLHSPFDIYEGVVLCSHKELVASNMDLIKMKVFELCDQVRHRECL